MKVLYSLCCFVCAMLYNNAAQAYFSPYHTGTPPIEKTETKPNAEPKLSSAGYIKYAAVNFISKRSGITSDASGDDLDSMPIKETSCPTGQTKVDGICIDVAACNTSFPLTSVSSKIGSYVTKNCGSGNRYCYTSCQTGWTHSGCNCTANDCAGFPLSTSSNNCNGVKSCKTGDSYKYKCTGCATGYTLTDAGTCVSTACHTYGAGYLDASTAHCKKNDIKRNGEQHCYKCTECEDGWVLGSDFACSAKPCSDYGATYSSSQTPNCVAHETKKSGDNFCYRCSACGEGWKLNTSTYKCEAKGCSTGFSSTAIQHCKSSTTEKNGNGFCYKCTECDGDDGWKLSGTSCIAKGCTASTSQIAHCTSYSEVSKSGGGYCYKCKTCEDGYTLNSAGTACTAISCATSKSQISYCTKYEKIAKAGDSVCYKCSECASGYTLNSAGTSCTAKSCATNYTTGSTNLAQCANAISQIAGENICHTCTSCNPGWSVNGGKCVASGCPTGYSASAVTNCQSSETTPSGTDTCYKCKSCVSGWKLSSNTCVAKTCSDYGAGYQGSTISNCSTSDKQPAGNSYCYKCTACNSGWTVSNGSCVAAGCPTGYSSGTIANCASSQTTTSGNNTCYKCNSCSSGWTLSGNSCTAASCSGYSLASCPDHGNCSSCQSGSNYKYALNSCDSGYEKSGNSCNAASCSGYALSSCPEHGNCGTCKSGTSDKYALNSCQDGYTMNGNTCVTASKYAVGDAVYTPDGTPIGVVFYDDGKVAKILSYVEFSHNSYTPWSDDEFMPDGRYRADVLCIPTDTRHIETLIKGSESDALKDMNGRWNTMYALAREHIDGTCELGSPGSAGVGLNMGESDLGTNKIYHNSVTHWKLGKYNMGAWHLPSLGELNKICQGWKNNGPIKQTLAGMEGLDLEDRILDGTYWSSTLSGSTAAWQMQFSGDTCETTDQQIDNSSGGLTRAVMDFFYGDFAPCGDGKAYDVTTKSCISVPMP